MKIRNIAAVFSAALAFSGLAYAAGGAGGEIQKADPNQHFHPKGKPPSEHTLKVLQKARDTMPFDDTRDFDEAKKGFIAPLNSMIVEADAGHVAWDIERYEFLRADKQWPSVHPSTQRQGHLSGAFPLRMAI